jgi:hypothetical protein
VVAQFLQHDSRDRDPQLHVHQAILNRVLCADGLWRALDGQALFLHKAAAGAVAERVMETYLTWTLGIRFETRPDGRAREQDVRDLFSSRRHAITAKAEQLVAAFTAKFSREPSPLEHNRLSQQATLATRKAKSHDGETLGDRLDRWARECHAAVATSLAQIGRDVLDLAQRADPPAEWSERDVIERALTAVARGQQSWTRSDLMRAISDELPPRDRGQRPLDHVTLRPLGGRVSPLREVEHVAPDLSEALRDSGMTLACPSVQSVAECLTVVALGFAGGKGGLLREPVVLQR